MRFWVYALRKTANRIDLAEKKPAAHEKNENQSIRISRTTVITNRKVELYGGTVECYTRNYVDW